MLDREDCDVYCVDCKKWTKQKFRGRNIYDNSKMYLCSECGCENYVEDESETKENEV